METENEDIFEALKLFFEGSNEDDADNISIDECRSSMESSTGCYNIKSEQESQADFTCFDNLIGNFGAMPMANEMKSDQAPTFSTYIGKSGLVPFTNDANFEIGFQNESTSYNCTVGDFRAEEGNHDSCKKRQRMSDSHSEMSALALATQQCLDSLHLDSNSKEYKQQKRAIRNRLSAKLSRERKTSQIEDLQAVVIEKDREIMMLESEVRYLKIQLDAAGIFYISKVNINIDIKDDGSNHSCLYESLTTPEDSDDTESLSVSNLSEIGTESSESHSMGKRLYSLLSIVFMVSLTMFGGPSHGNDISSTMLSIPRTYVQPFDTQQFGFEHLKPHGRILHTETNEEDSFPVVVTSASQESSSLSLVKSFRNEIKVFSDRANKMIYTSSDHDMKNSQSASRSIVGPSQALWKYQDRALQLYPLLKRIDRLEDSFLYTIDDSKDFLRKNLRRRSGKVNPSSIFDKDKDKDKGRSPSGNLKANQDGISSASTNDKALVPAFPHYDGVDDSTTQMPVHIAGVSHVLMSQGKALLNPSLVFRQLEDTDHSRSHSHSPFAEKVDLKSSGGKMSTPVISVIDTTNIIHNLKSQSTSIQPVAIEPSDMGQSNLLMMLLPASSVRWGKSWSDSTERNVDWMLKTLNSTEQENDAFVNRKDSNHHDERTETVWLEIGCTVFRAQLVKNVTLSS